MKNMRKRGVGEKEVHARKVEEKEVEWLVDWITKTGTQTFLKWSTIVTGK